MRNRVPPNQVPIGAEWLNSMPQGDGWFPRNAAQPVVEVQFRRCQGNVQVVEYLYGEIQPAQLGHGTDTNAQVRRWVQTVVGRRNDDAGHIIGRNQGGLGTVEWNIFPQNGHFNRGAYSASVERLISDSVRRFGTARIWFRFVYGSTREPCRPTSFNFFVIFNDGSTLHNDLLNP